VPRFPAPGGAPFPAKCVADVAEKSETLRVHGRLRMHHADRGNARALPVTPGDRARA
jgi:hypothetical protein